MIVTAKYRALFLDNYQGSSGMPFEDKIVFNIDDDSTLESLFGCVNYRLDELKKKGETMHHTNEVMLISVEVSDSI